MHTFYKEHDGSYAVAVQWLVSDGVSGSYHGWHNVFNGLSLEMAIFMVHHLNGGNRPSASYHPALLDILKECAA